MVGRKQKTQMFQYSKHILITTIVATGVVVKVVHDKQEKEKAEMRIGVEVCKFSMTFILLNLT